MENGIEPKTYELAYHLIPDLEEADIKAHAQELSGLVEQNGGSILTYTLPKRIHLSYPVRGKQYAHFGVMDFTAPAETIEKLNSQMKLQNGLLRYLLLKKPPEGKDVRILGIHRTTRSAMKTKLHETPSKKKVKIPTEKAPEGEIEKEIEKVIEGL